MSTEFDSRASQHISPNECRAMRLLREDGWSPGELRMTFMVGREAVARHSKGRCQHGGGQ